MSELTISINLAELAPTDPNYWIELEQEVEQPIAKQEEAAAVIDELFGLEACVEEAPEPKETPVVDWEEKYEEMLEKLRVLAEEAGLCEEEDGSYTAYVRVKRSHQDKPYNLLIQNGELTQTTTGHTETISRVLKIDTANSVSIQLPGDQEITATWQGSCYGIIGKLATNPELYVSGNQISWNGNVSGAIRVSYSQPYDLATIEAFGENCIVTALGYLSVDEIELEPPPEDEEAEDLCKKIGGYNIPDPPGDCYIENITSEYCNCSGALYASDSVLQPTACPEDVPPGATIGFEETSVYVNCGEEDRVHDPDYYEDVCCDPPGSGLPRCQNVYSNWSGKGASKEQLESYWNMFNGRVRVVGVGPEDPPCGVFTISQDINQINCCLDITPIVIDVPRTTWTISLPGSATLRATGGEAPYYWETSGGYIFGNGTNKDVTTSTENTIFTNDQKVCGDATTTLHDDCSSVSFLTNQTATDLQPILPVGLMVAADAMTGVSLDRATVAPYTWTASGDISWMYGTTDTPSNILVSGPDFCGMGGIMVTDACGNTDSAQVKSTQGHWEPVIGFDPCSPDGSVFPNPSQRSSTGVSGLISADGEWKMDGYNGQGGSFAASCVTPGGFPCPVGDKVIFDTDVPENIAASYSPDTCGNDATVHGGCVRLDFRSIVECNAGDPPGYGYLPLVQLCTSLWHWECP